MVWSAVSLASRRASGRLIHQAMKGEKNQRPRMGPATANDRGLESVRYITAATARTGAIHMDRQKEPRSVRPLPYRLSDVLHSRSRLWVTSIRQPVRTIASRLK